MKKLLGALSIVCAVFVIASCNLPQGTGIDAGVATVEKDINGKKIVAYFPDWQGSVDSVQWDKLTHVNYSFVFPTKDGNLTGIKTDILTNMVTKAHQNGVQALVAIGGWDIGDGGGVDKKFHTIATDETLRETFVKNVMAFVSKYDLDGIDIDWEHPNTAAEKESYAVFMKDLGIALHAKGKLLTTAIACDSSTPNFIKSEVFGYCDFVNLMAYDAAADNHSPYSFAVNALDTYVKNKGLPADKAILGVPFYGRKSWTDAKTYSQLLAAGADANKDTYNGYYYNGIDTIKKKTKLAMEKAGGVMFWEVSQDVNDKRSLLTTIYNEIKGINSATPTPTATVDPNVTPSPTPTATPVPPCTLDAYVHGTVYPGEKQVHYNGHNWKAKWWTQNEYPGTGGSGVWEDLGVCGDNPATLTPTVTPTFTQTVGPTATPTATQGTGVQPWAASVSYTPGNIVSYSGSTYTCLQAHTSLVGWEPANVAALWSKN